MGDHAARERAAQLEAHAALLERLATENPQTATIAELAREAREAANAALVGGDLRDSGGDLRDPAHDPQPDADRRTRAQLRASLQLFQARATRDGMADRELISFAEAGRRIPKPNGEPRAERTMQDWAQRGLLPVWEISPHVRFVDWTEYLHHRPGGNVLPSGDTDTKE